MQSGRSLETVSEFVACHLRAETGDSSALSLFSRSIVCSLCNWNVNPILLGNSQSLSEKNIMLVSAIRDQKAQQSSVQLPKPLRESVTGLLILFARLQTVPNSRPSFFKLWLQTLTSNFEACKPTCVSNDESNQGDQKNRIFEISIGCLQRSPYRSR